MVPNPLLLRPRAAFPDSINYLAHGPSEVTCVIHCHPLRNADLPGATHLALGHTHGWTRVYIDRGDTMLRVNDDRKIVLVSPKVAGRYLPASHPDLGSW